MICQFCDRGGKEIAAGAAGDIVQDDRNRGCICYGGKVGNQTVLGGLVVIRCDNQQGVSAGLAGVADVLQHMERVVGAGAGNYGNPTCDAVDGEADDVFLLGVFQCGAFAGSADGHDGVDAGINLKINQTAQCVIIDREIIVHRGDDCGSSAFKYGTFHRMLLSGMSRRIQTNQGVWLYYTLQVLQ